MRFLKGFDFRAPYKFLHKGDKHPNAGPVLYSIFPLYIGACESAFTLTIISHYVAMNTQGNENHLIIFENFLITIEPSCYLLFDSSCY